MRAFLLLLLAGLAWVASLNAEPLSLAYGVNTVDINSDGVPDMIIRTRWDNQNAHSFDRYLVALRHGNEWLEVPLEGRSESAFPTAEGADCGTEDDMAIHIGYVFRLKGVVEIDRFARQWKKPQNDYPVIKTTFQLATGEEGLAGQPPFYFKKVKEEKLKQRYCDMRELIK